MRVISAPLLLLCACELSAGGPDRPREAARAADRTVRDEVVAEVDGVPITAGRVAELSRETGRAPRQVVERLVTFELLAAEARRRGLERDRETRDAVRRATVQRYLEEELERTHRPEDMPEPMLRRAYEQNKHQFVRPRLVKVAHVLVEAPAKTASRSELAAARRHAAAVRRQLAEAASAEEFLEAGRRLADELPVKLVVEDIAQSVYRGARLDPAFVEAALGLEEPGELSEPVVSSFGVHVIFLKEAREPVNRSFEDARDEVAEREHPFWVKSAFADLTERLRLSSKVAGWTGEQRREAGE